MEGAASQWPAGRSEPGHVDYLSPCQPAGPGA